MRNTAIPCLRMYPKVTFSEDIQRFMGMDVRYSIIHNSNDYDGNNENNYHVLCPYFKSSTMKALYITSLSSQSCPVKVDNM